MVITVLCAVILVLIAFLVFDWCYKVYVKVWIEGYSPVNYLQTSRANIDSWRWREPHRELRIPFNVITPPGIRNTPNVSSLTFRFELRFSDFSLLFLGLTLISINFFGVLALIVSALNSFWNLPTLVGFFTCLCLLYLGFLCLQNGNRVLRIDLYPERVEIITRFALFLSRTAVYQRHQLLSINGRVQSFWMMEKGQIQPDYRLMLTRARPGYFQMKQTFSLRCNPTQGSWIVGGLNHWKSLSNYNSQLS